MLKKLSIKNTVLVLFLLLCNINILYSEDYLVQMENSKDLIFDSSISNKHYKMKFTNISHSTFSNLGNCDIYLENFNEIYILNCSTVTIFYKNPIRCRNRKSLNIAKSFNVNLSN